MTTDPGLGPNAELIGQADGLDKLATPALILWLDIFERNLARMADFRHESGLGIRPHAKTHKCSQIARRQIEAGALGVCTATLHEAEAMVAGGVSGVLITSPVVGDRKIEQLARLNGHADGLMVVVDNAENADALAQAARVSGNVLSVIIDTDIGMHRTGVDSAEATVALANQVVAQDSLEYRGIQGYSGRVQHIEEYSDRDKVYGAELARFAAYAAALTEAKMPPAIITGGGTGTLAIDAQKRVITEHQAGSFIFMDVEYNLVEILDGQNESPFEVALIMRNSVVSNNAAGFVTIDGGFKCFATDGPVPELHAGASEGSRYEYFGDEHGRIVFAEKDETLPLGAPVDLITPHCDPTVNLHDFIHVVRDGVIEDIWRIDARGVL